MGEAVGRPVDTREVPDGYELVAVPVSSLETGGEWRPVTGKRCRYARQGRIQCVQPSVAEVQRGEVRVQWWAYCASHCYGKWVEDGQVMTWILREKEECAGG